MNLAFWKPKPKQRRIVTGVVSRDQALCPVNEGDRIVCQVTKVTKTHIAPGEYQVDHVYAGTFEAVCTTIKYPKLSGGKDYYFEFWLDEYPDKTLEWFEYGTGMYLKDVVIVKVLEHSNQ